MTEEFVDVGEEVRGVSRIVESQEAEITASVHERNEMIRVRRWRRNGSRGGERTEF